MELSLSESCSSIYRHSCSMVVRNRSMSLAVRFNGRWCRICVQSWRWAAHIPRMMFSLARRSWAGMPFLDPSSSAISWLVCPCRSVTFLASTEGAISRRRLLGPTETVSVILGSAEIAFWIFRQLGRDGRVGIRITTSGTDSVQLILIFWPFVATTCYLIKLFIVTYVLYFSSNTQSLSFWFRFHDFLVVHSWCM